MFDKKTVGVEDNFNGITAKIMGRVVDNGAGRSLQAVCDLDGGVWFTDQRYHAQPTYTRLPITWSLAVLLMRTNSLNDSIESMRREGYPEDFIERYRVGVWNDPFPSSLWSREQAELSAEGFR